MAAIYPSYLFYTNGLLRLDRPLPALVPCDGLESPEIDNTELDQFLTHQIDHVFILPRMIWNSDRGTSVFHPLLTYDGRHGRGLNLKDMSHSPEYCEQILRKGFDDILTDPLVPNEVISPLLPDAPFLKVTIDAFGPKEYDFGIPCLDEDGIPRTWGWIAYKLANMVSSVVKSAIRKGNCRTPPSLISSAAAPKTYDLECLRIMGLLFFEERGTCVPVLGYTPPPCSLN
ncbi:hypothetical protein CC1G_10411 [Coprinopsis cinerea okayama7|uniref:Uncharacterized protein n=1 Tax=Coprinopsis cinerea (strain Okayama-7 / 130 / ATCC MYA-4618 / FGSC 9003) TaxID=240176 RepID=A8PAP6_COPC7|nr:hypothetical protein CC1G_10411 [Coprinopsis cinerea okayama7\|eukprot:XP_001840027.1 hypothetical protein CC1G_10411 [Coprinopsis cinerea okayama7\